MPSEKSQCASESGGRRASPPAVSASSSSSPSARRQTLGLSSLPLKWLPAAGSPAMTKLTLRIARRDRRGSRAPASGPASRPWARAGCCTSCARAPGRSPPRRWRGRRSRRRSTSRMRVQRRIRLDLLRRRAVADRQPQPPAGDLECIARAASGRHAAEDPLHALAGRRGHREDVDAERPGQRELPGLVEHGHVRAGADGLMSGPRSRRLRASRRRAP